MLCLEDTWFVAAFHSTPMHDPGLKEVQRQSRGASVGGLISHKKGKRKGERESGKGVACEGHRRLQSKGL